MPYVKVHVTPERLERAKFLESQIPATIGRSIKQGAGRLGGCIGEVCAVDFFKSEGWEIIQSNEKIVSYCHDFTILRMIKGKTAVGTLESKCTERTFFARPHYHVHVASSQYLNQSKCTAFLFTSLKYKEKSKRNGRGYEYSEPEFLEIVGLCLAKDIKNKFKFRREGECGDDSKPAVWDEYYAPISQLTQLGKGQVI